MRKLLIALALVLLVVAGLGGAYNLASVQPRYDQAVQSSLQNTEDARSALVRGDGAAADRETGFAQERLDAAGDLRTQRDFVWTAVGVFLLAALVIVVVIVIRRPRDPSVTTTPPPNAPGPPVRPGWDPDARGVPPGRWPPVDGPH